MCYQECALYGDLVLYLRDRAAFARAEAACTDRPALYWYLARLYADHGFFDESAEALAHLLPSAGEDVQRLWAEVSWWREYGERLPWIF